MLRIGKHVFAAACALAALAGDAWSHHVDPFEVIDRAMTAYQQNESYADMRAVLSAALRDAPHDGKLHPDFGIVYAIYSDMARFEGNPSFALLLAEEGLALVESAPEPDVEMRNALSTSLAYALADLGRYAEAIEAATIAALWLEQRFGEQARLDLEAEIRGWVEKQDSGDLPSAGEIALDLLQRAEDALAAGDSANAIVLASRARLPQATGLSEGAMRMVNAWAHSVLGAAYSIEGRHGDAALAYLDGIDMLATQRWDGRSIIEIYPDAATEGTNRIVWDLFIRLASSAMFLDERDLADAALRNVGDLATTPEARFSLLVQRANILLATDDFKGVEALFRQSEEEARAAGDEKNATLARFYTTVARLRQADDMKTSPMIPEMLEAAKRAAEAAGEDSYQSEYILTTAARAGINYAQAHAETLPVSRLAYATFVNRQKKMAGYETGQDAARRERRRFLETHLDALYETSRDAAPRTAKRRAIPAAEGISDPSP